VQSRNIFGLHCLKHDFIESNENVVECFLENLSLNRMGRMVMNTFGIATPLGQHEFLIDLVSMNRWHKTGWKGKH